ncbi:bifunctional proline dehydrogenase/L-glutamate gamma-semialdehyde dehydrogenase [Nocardioides insulae]|uniref:bifunctional proline dehydrogenase/L-glutamate gamma-semialdehyde dehydrogenase n=1 Tax=Nocardioides insulae TaxID=394734 RepID=UPI0003F6CB0D|nr:bifunctional proline dehydrogenase/L-glutamate gamma-semialdehyde dehydrogenase [Nocardioides insulae]
MSTVPDQHLVPEVDRLVRGWLDVAATKPVDPAAQRLAGVLKDPGGLEFTVGFVDRVIRPEDVHVAAHALQELAGRAPKFLPWHLRAGLRLGALLSMVAPGFVIPIVRRALREMVGHLLVDATDAKLGKAIDKIRRDDVRLNINLLGEAVLGEKEAAKRLAGTRKLLSRPDVDYVSIKVSSTVAPHNAWAFDQAVEHIEESLLPLFRLAAESCAQGQKKFINLDMEEYRDLDLTVAVFTRLLDRPELLDLEAGIVLQAYLPDAVAAMVRLQEWSADRRARGGAAVKVRVVKGANLPMEHVEADLHGWPVATWGTKQDSDTNYKRVLRYALTSERVRNVRIGVAGHNLFDIAYAWALAGERDVRDGIEFEMLLGMATGQAEAVRETVGGLLLYTPVVHPGEFDVAIAYLVRRLEEGASQDNFMSAVFDLHDDSTLFERERERFLASLAAVDETVPEPNRRQDRRTTTGADLPAPEGQFANAADTDPSLPGNRDWGRRITARVAGSTLGEDLVAAHTLTDADVLEQTIQEAVAAGKEWGARSGAERAAVLRRAAGVLESRRADLLEVMASECGKTLDQSDPEVSEAIDFVTFYAHLAEELDTVDGAVAVPVGLTVVTPPWNFPVAIPTGSTVSALAAGSSVIVKPAVQASRCGSVMVQALWDAGVPREVLRLVHVDEGDLGRQLVAHPAVDRLILTGAFDTAALFRSFRPDLQLLAETSGKNSIIVTPDADLDLAAKDLAASAFGHAGQKCSAASLGILVGSVATSRRFREQLVDAVTSLKVGYPSDPTTQMGPVIEPVSGKLERVLTTLAPGESWLVEPKPLDDSGRLWSPGVKTGVQRGSEYHLTEYFGPVLGLIETDSLEEAIEIQNQVDYGLTAGIHTLERAEIATWLDRVQAGNAYVNRGITGAIVRRQPFGGWKKSAVGAGTKAGGPNYLVGLVDWEPAEASISGGALCTPVRRLIDAAARLDVPADELAMLRRAFATDQSAWVREFGAVSDVSGLDAERNVLRYLPVPVWVRHEGGPIGDLLRVVGAGLRAGAAVRVSLHSTIDLRLVDLLRELGVEVAQEDAATWRAALADLPSGRVRLLGGDRQAFAEASAGRPEIALYAQPVVEAGRVELLPFLHEQAVSMTAHRFGSPTSLVRGLLD